MLRIPAPILPSSPSAVGHKGLAPSSKGNYFSSSILVLERLKDP